MSFTDDSGPWCLLQVKDPIERLGSDNLGHESLRKHPFFQDTNWQDLHLQNPPELAYVAPKSPTHPTRRSMSPDIFDTFDATIPKSPSSTFGNKAEVPQWLICQIDQGVHTKSYHRTQPYILPSEEVLRASMVWKRRSFKLPRQRGLILTSTPRLIYVNVAKAAQKGQIDLRQITRVISLSDKNFEIVTVRHAHRSLLQSNWRSGSVTGSSVSKIWNRMDRHGWAWYELIAQIWVGISPLPGASRWCTLKWRSCAGKHLWPSWWWRKLWARRILARSYNLVRWCDLCLSLLLP